MKKTYNNNIGPQKGATLLEMYFDNCAARINCNKRWYNAGIKSLLDDDAEDTIYVDNILVSAEGISPRWLLLS